MRSLWWAPLTGVAFLVLGFVGFVVAGEPPDAQSDVQEIIDHYVDNKGSIQAASFIGGASTLLFLFFAGVLRSTLRAAEGENGVLSALMLVGATIMAVGFAIDGTILLSLAEAADDIDPSAVQALQALWDNDFLPIALGVIMFLLASGLSVVRNGALPAWVGWMAIVLAVVGLTPIGFVAFIGAALWILIVSVMLTVRARSATSAA
jgi:hypothetical protein